VNATADIFVSDIVRVWIDIHSIDYPIRTDMIALSDVYLSIG
jgi:hypothetical protein